MTMSAASDRGMIQRESLDFLYIYNMLQIDNNFNITVQKKITTMQY